MFKLVSLNSFPFLPELPMYYCISQLWRQPRSNQFYIQFSSIRPRSANKNQHNLYPKLTVDSLIDETSRTWNLQVIRTMVDPQDVKIIESIRLSRFHTEDRDGWYFTNNGRYTVKSGYQVE